MQTKSHFLFLEIDSQEFIFAASEGFDDNFKSKTLAYIHYQQPPQTAA